MSPPCAATIFDGDNGGATSAGVSATEIRVAIPGLAPSPVADDRITIDSLFDYFNNRYEFYGRRLVPVYVGGGAATAVDARALAASVAAENVFGAITTMVEWGSPQPALAQGLAHGRVVTAVQNIAAWWSDRTLFDALHPYLWSVYPSSEDVQANLADFICSGLAGQPARFAGDAALTTKTRVFGVMAVGAITPPAAGLLSAALAACNAPAVNVQWVTANGPATMLTSLAQLREAGVTTLVCVCEGLSALNDIGLRMKTAAYYPEWILSPSPWGGNNDDEYGVQSRRSSGYLVPPMRLSAGPRLVPVQARAWYQALLAANPTQATNSSGAFGGSWARAGFVYDQLLLLASGIQAAGPQLTPDTFGQGLFSLAFPNPGAGQAPTWQPSAGFGPGDHSFYDDYTIGWFSDTAESLNQPASPSPVGSWCYLGGGSRFRVGGYPASLNDKLFNAAAGCR